MRADSVYDPFADFKWVFGKFMHDPGPEKLEALLPVNWLKTRLAVSPIIEAPAA